MSEIIVLERHEISFEDLLEIFHDPKHLYFEVEPSDKELVYVSKEPFTIEEARKYVDEHYDDDFEDENDD